MPRTLKYECLFERTVKWASGSFLAPTLPQCPRFIESFSYGRKCQSFVVYEILILKAPTETFFLNGYCNHTIMGPHVQHSGAVVSAVSSQQEGPEFDPGSGRFYADFECSSEYSGFLPQSKKHANWGLG